MFVSVNTRLCVNVNTAWPERWVGSDKPGCPRTNRLCLHCEPGTREREMHFLTQCAKYEDMRRNYLKKIGEVLPEFLLVSSEERLSYLTGENEECLVLAAQYVSSCHKRRESPSKKKKHTKN